MKNYSGSIFLIFGLFLISCNGQNKESATRTVKPKGNPVVAKITISIQPLGGFSVADANAVSKELGKIYSGNITVNQPIPIPASALNYNKTRYRADSLIAYLGRKTPKGYLTIGLTDKDISTTMGKNKDWGVFGLGFRPGNSCVASLFRLKGSNRKNQLFKVAIHELGHTQGLKHCPVNTCIMRDAKGKNHLNQLKDFCQNCKPVLVKVGWQFKQVY